MHVCDLDVPSLADYVKNCILFSVYNHDHKNTNPSSNIYLISNWNDYIILQTTKPPEYIKILSHKS